MAIMNVDDLVPARIAADVDAGLDVATLQDADVFEVLSSATARRILRSLRSSPATASTVADDLEVSLQVAAYHLDRLEAVGLVAPVATTYSEKGRSMDVYAVPTESFTVDLREQDAGGRCRESTED
jgi:DNA-binding transcriptional ArsR family regulator